MTLRIEESIDESMIPYYNDKPISVEYNICALAEAYGYVVHFEPYQGVKKGKQVASSNKWRLRENVVLLRTEGLVTIFSYYLFIDN